MRNALFGNRFFWWRIALAGFLLTALHADARARLREIGASVGRVAAFPRATEGASVRDEHAIYVCTRGNRALIWPREADAEVWAEPAPEMPIPAGTTVGIRGVAHGGVIREARIRPLGGFLALRLRLITVSLGMLAVCLLVLARAYRWGGPPHLLELRRCPTD
jgi:hypothetical protein